MRYHTGRALLLASAALLAVGWMASAQTQQTGVLLLAHGGKAEWNAEVERIKTAVDAQRPAEVAFGMASRATIQAAVDRLEARGVKSIVAVPLFISSHSSVVTSTEFLLGLRTEAPEDLAMFAKMNHGGGHGAPGAGASSNAHAGHGSGEAAAPAVDGTKPVTHTVPIRMSSALDDDPVVSAILTDRAKALSTDPVHEVVILVAHGPVEDEENALWLKTMSTLATAMGQQTQFARLDVVTVRDDAPDTIRAEATKELRGMVEQARSEGHRVLIVPLLLSYGGIEAGIRKRLDGLDYTMGKQGLLPDDRLASWVLGRVAQLSAGTTTAAGKTKS